MKKCELCRSSFDDSTRCGNFVTKNEITVHTFCLYLTSNLRQGGSENEGLLGFLPKDIRNEVNRVSKQTCVYCHKRYANIGCCERKCRRCFHFVCGLQNGCENQFINTFMSFCSLHIQVKRPAPPEDNAMCNICFDDLRGPEEKFNPITMLQPQCCRSGWFHKWCLQRMAQTSGYFFNCPLCQNKDKFRKQLPFQGIFIPDKDADWELEENAYAELLMRPNACEASVCKNRQGREKETAKNPLMICKLCGGIAMHKYCVSSHQRGKFTCDECNNMLTKHEYVESTETDQGIRSLQEDEENVFVDVCNDSTSSDDFNNFRGFSNTRNRFNHRRIIDSDDSWTNQDDDNSHFADGKIQNKNEYSDGFQSCIDDEKSMYNDNTSFEKDIQRMSHNSTMIKAAGSPQNTLASRLLSKRNIDTSCVANHTRRKSALNLSVLPEESKEHIAITPILGSPIANRTRRKSMHRELESQSCEPSRTLSTSSSASSSDFDIGRQRSIKRSRHLSSTDCSDDAYVSASSTLSFIPRRSVKRRRVRYLSSTDSENCDQPIQKRNAGTHTTSDALQTRFAATLYRHQNSTAPNFNIHRAYLT